LRMRRELYYLMITQRYNYTPLARETIDGKRHYCLPNGNRVPSVTTILDRTKPQAARDALANWKKSVGEKRAQEITTEAANRGTRMHTYLESYVLTDDMRPLPSNPYAQPSWYMAAEVILQGLQHATEYWGTEVPVYYSGLYAGTTDLVGEWKGRPAIMDFKQSNKVKKREWIEDYFLQLAAYALAHNEMHGTDIKTGVILMAVQPKLLSDNTYTKPQYLEFEIKDTEFEYWTDQWTRRVELYYLTA
jgi:CRISPR/Cas system-associated exonuclease Cas4 (RecB family)